MKVFPRPEAGSEDPLLHFIPSTAASSGTIPENPNLRKDLLQDNTTSKESGFLGYGKAILEPG